MTELPQTDELREKVEVKMIWLTHTMIPRLEKEVIDCVIDLIQADRTEHITRASELTELKIRAHEIGLQPASPYGRRRLDELTKKIDALSKQEEQNV